MTENENKKHFLEYMRTVFYKDFRKELDHIWCPELMKSEQIEVVDIWNGETFAGIMVLEDNYIDCIYVLPKFRRQGLARKAVIDYFKDKRDYPSLIIINKNHKAKEFWNSLFYMSEVDGNFIETRYQVTGYKF